ncbi:MAG: ribosomal L7Ae/L30e/S12e/Gadd45 family protein [Nanoarchaeota archaeon]
MTAQTENAIKELKSVLNTGKLVMGTEQTLKELKKNSLTKVFLASNTPDNVREDVEYYAGIAGAEVVALSVPNEELGVMCQKPFYISVLGVRK